MIPDTVERLRIHEVVAFAVKGRLKNNIPRYSRQIATLPNAEQNTMMRTFLAVNFSLDIFLSSFSVFLGEMRKYQTCKEHTSSKEE
jgi:hypothetical protein